MAKSETWFLFRFSTLRIFYVKIATSEGGGLHILSWETTKKTSWPSEKMYEILFYFMKRKPRWHFRAGHLGLRISLGKASVQSPYDWNTCGFHFPFLFFIFTTSSQPGTTIDNVLWKRFNLHRPIRAVYLRNWKHKFLLLFWLI